VHKIDIAYTLMLIPTKSIELIEMKQILQTSKQKTQEQHIKGQGLEIFGCLNYPSTPWWDFSIVQERIATAKGKMSNVKNF